MILEDAKAEPSRLRDHGLCPPVGFMPDKAAQAVTAHSDRGPSTCALMCSALPVGSGRQGSVVVIIGTPSLITELLTR
jgi:hypothetical protein